MDIQKSLTEFQNMSYYAKYEEEYQQIIKVNKSLSRKVVSFQGNKKIPFLRLFKYKEAFSTSLIELFLNESGKDGNFLDPFAGICTSLFTANKKCLNSTGIELLPVGHFIFDSRIAFERVNFKKLKDVISKIKTLNFKKLPINKEYVFKHIPITENAFPLETEYELNSYLTFLEEVKYDPDVKHLLRFAALCILEEISYTVKSGQYLRWDKRANKSKTKYMKPIILQFKTALLNKLNNIIADLTTKKFFQDSNKLNFNTINLKRGTVFEILPKMEGKSIDLIITSPPYLNRYDYTRIYALELVFLGKSNDDVKELRQSLLSCTVENKEKYDYLRDIYEKFNRNDDFQKAVRIFQSNPLLKEIIDKFEILKEDKKLNNNNICNLIYNYFFEHAFVIMEFYRIMRGGGKIFYVNDNVRFSGQIIPVDIILSEFAKASGFKIKEIYKLPVGKGNSSQQMGEYGREELRKCVYIWEK